MINEESLVQDITVDYFTMSVEQTDWRNFVIVQLYELNGFKNF